MLILQSSGPPFSWSNPPRQTLVMIHKQQESSSVLFFSCQKPHSSPWLSFTHNTSSSFEPLIDPCAANLELIFVDNRMDESGTKGNQTACRIVSALLHRPRRRCLASPLLLPTRGRRYLAQAQGHSHRDKHMHEDIRSLERCRRRLQEPSRRKLGQTAFAPHIAFAGHVATPLDKACFDVLNVPYTHV